MPSTVRKRDFTKADGTSGSYVVIDERTREQKSCHDTRQDAEAAARIRDQQADDT